MLAIADSAQQGLFDSSWCGKVVPRDSFYGLLAEQGVRIVCDGDFADCYAAGRGRPSIPPSTLAKILLLAYRCGLSDRQAMEAVRFDLRWKVALGLPLDHEGFHATSLVKFRARLLLHGKERVVFERSLELASELGLISGQVEQILDSTPMLGAAAVAEAASVLREIIGQEFAVADDDVPRVRGGRRGRQILSAHDPEMRHGRQTSARRFTGYKLHAAAASEAPILTAVSLSAGNEHDGQQAGALVDQQPEQRRPKRVIGDTAYGNVEAREQLEQRSISVLAPLHSTSPKDGTIAKEEFAIDLATDTVTCPRGKTAPIYKSRPRRPNATLRPSRPKGSGDRVARFARTDCEPCPLRPRCTPGGQRDVRISRREDLRQAALQALSDPAERDHLKRTRPRIERLLGLIVYRYRGRRSRYLGKRKSTLQAVWTAVLVNLHPIAAALRANPA